MAVLTRTEIPAAINTIERLFIWVAQCVMFLTWGMTRNIYYNEEAAPLCNVQTIRGADGNTYWQIVAHMPYNLLDYNSSTSKTWMSGIDVSGSVLPTVLKTD